jgi:diguanylate cyclase (GGDEF)-like protein
VPDEVELVRRALVRARHEHLEEPVRALDEAVRCHETARALGHAALCGRALALQGAISLHRGDLRGALGLAVEAERCVEGADAGARAEVAALKAQVSFFTGSYAEALGEAERAIALADESGDHPLRIWVRRTTCIVFGNVGVRDWPERLAEVLELAVAAGDGWQEAISRNDLACLHQEQGDVEAAEREIERAMAVAEGLTGPKRFALGVLHSTRADIRLLAGRHEEALADAERSIALLTESGEPNPYVLGVTVRAEVHALMALGRLEDAQASGESALSRLGDRVPQTRSLILGTLAGALKEAGRLEEAYDALSRAADLERQAFRELSELQLSLERAAMEITAARRETEALAAKNRQLRDQADRDWLTGLHNRRYLARELERLAGRHDAGPLSLAVVDLDRFKDVNDRFGHDVGDRVLVRVAALLREVLRGSDIVVRSGGEEFLVLMPFTDAGAAAAACERIRAAVRSEPWERIASGLSLTTSAGVASTDTAGDLEPLVKLADGRLYDAKRAGRDRVVSGRS